MITCVEPGINKVTGAPVQILIKRLENTPRDKGYYYSEVGGDALTGVFEYETNLGTALRKAPTRTIRLYKGFLHSVDEPAIIDIDVIKTYYWYIHGRQVNEFRYLKSLTEGEKKKMQFYALKYANE